MKKIALLTGLAALSLTLTACGSDTPSSSTTTASNQTATKPDTSEEDKKKAEEEAKQKAADEAKQKELAEKVKYAELTKTGFPNMTENKPELPQQTYDFIVANNKLFPAKTTADIQKLKGMADKTITAKHLNKNAAPYFNKVATFAGQVVNVEEAPIDGGDTVSILHVVDNNMQSYQVLMLKSSGDILQEDTVRFWGVPAGGSSFSNVSGGTTNVQLFVGGHVEKQK
ncbi:hypothetical protein DFP93_111101 [Aneurinibacillus soli]|uniref:Uncharacterized protein n=1 Tax=Aneurinibacillus soli TaxID=1500254 RepID=A0A0U5ASL7_9BACL|nr:hypothetical protein [Aneurinibacillus soli]PYE60921.1 hypothetical protein DFP93_111101 [Aneurinibacillus soli]BAU26826.1 hypothetical protein CB4_00995 [Aneurinibacillus soli]